MKAIEFQRSRCWLCGVALIVLAMLTVVTSCGESQATSVASESTAEIAAQGPTPAATPATSLPAPSATSGATVGERGDDTLQLPGEADLARYLTGVADVVSRSSVAADGPGAWIAAVARQQPGAEPSGRDHAAVVRIVSAGRSGWSTVAEVSLDNAEQARLEIDLSQPIEVADVTGDGTPDFLVYSFEAVAVISRHSGTWQIVWTDNSLIVGEKVSLYQWIRTPPFSVSDGRLVSHRRLFDGTDATFEVVWAYEEGVLVGRRA